jgi:putative transposon-encoded protein
MTKKVAEKAMEIRLEGYEVVEKVAKQCATSGRILVPKHWVGKRVKAIRVEP